MRKYEVDLRARKEELNAQNKEISLYQIFDYCSKQLPDYIKRAPWQHVNHGVDLLSTENQLNAYIASYGEMHQTKLLAALQTFDYDKLDSSFEIIDWGCGQGIGTLVLLNLLKEHGKMDLLKRVTLIEPSAEALERAIINVRITEPTLEIIPINKYLPGDGTFEEVTHIDHNCNTVIDIFSNILDIETINLPTLARLIADISATQFIICVGPMNSSYQRINQFAEMFTNKNVISKIAEPRFGYTKATNHIFSCVTNCFIYNNSPINTTQHEFTPVLINGKRVYDDYDDNMLLINKVFDDKDYQLYIKIKQGLSYEDSIFIKPIIGGDTPLMVVIRPGIGVLVVTSHSCNMSASDSLRRIISYQRNLFELHVKDLLIKAIIDSKHWALIKKLIFIKGSTMQTFKEEIINKDDHSKDLQYTSIIDERKLNTTKGIDLVHELRMDMPNSLFKPMLYRNFMKAMSGSWHSFRSGIEFIPSREQRILMESRPAKQKINGVAGSGKTQVLAMRAVNAHLRTGKRVLVLSFNITLTNYLEMRLDNIRKDFSWDMFDIMNYHQFFNAQAHNLGLTIKDLNAYDDITFFKDVKTPKYSAIFVDEVQDYKEEWLIILQKLFLEPEGEFVVFGDSKQNIYQRPLDVNGDIKLGTIKGVWNNSLGKSYRFVNQQLAMLSNSFQKEFFEEAHYVPIESQLSLSFEKNIHYYQTSKNDKADKLYNLCKGIMDDYANEKPEEDVRTTFTILSQTVDILRDIESLYLKEHGKGKTMTTFETQEQYEEVIAKSNRPSEDIDNIRSSKKRHFKCGSALIKLSTIHSFKGWESENVILVLQPEGKSSILQTYSVSKSEDTKELIYTGITRAKNRLYIIDMGNERFGSFLKKKISEI